MTYSGSQPYSDQSDNITNQRKQHNPRKIALIVEGGGMRGIFSAGVLDSFYELGFDPFHLYFGVSAGSLNLTSHLAGQYRRNYRVIMSCATSGQFISARKFLFGGHFLDLDWLGNECLALHPLDKHAAFQFLAKTRRKFIVVCTSIETGKPLYLRPTSNNIHNILLGSCSVPLLYRAPVYIDGERVVDGSVSDPIPVKEAYKQGATDIVVLRTRGRNYHKPSGGLQAKFTSFAYREFTSVQDAISRQASIYNDSVAFIEQPPPEVTVYQIAVEDALGSGRTTTSTPILNRDYQLGQQLGQRFVLQHRDKMGVNSRN